MKMSEFANLKNRVADLVETKQWVEANRLLLDSHLSLGFNLEHIAQCANLADELRDYISEEAVLSRLNQVFDGVTPIDVMPVFKGRSCIYALKIECLAGNKKLTVFEKIFPAHRANNAKKELRIYASNLIHSMLVPKLYGSVSQGNLISNYYQWVELQHINLMGYIRCLAEVMLNPSGYFLSAYNRELVLAYKTLDCLWSHQPDAIHAVITDKENNHFKNIPRRLDTTLFLSDKNLEKFMRAFAKDQYAAYIEKVVQFIKKNRQMIDRALDLMPIVLMHEDIHGKNMLGKPDLKVILIDWENYVFSRVGDGFFRVYNFRPFFLFKIHLRKLAYQHKLNYKALLLSITVYELVWVIRKNKTQSFERLSRILDAYFPNGQIHGSEFKQCT